MASPLARLGQACPVQADPRQASAGLALAWDTLSIFPVGISPAGCVDTQCIVVCSSRIHFCVYVHRYIYIFIYTHGGVQPVQLGGMLGTMTVKKKPC